MALDRRRRATSPTTTTMGSNLPGVMALLLSLLLLMPANAFHMPSLTAPTASSKVLMFGSRFRGVTEEKRHGPLQGPPAPLPSKLSTPTNLVMAAPKMLVTGFGPFQGMDDNPTTELVEMLRQQPGLMDGSLILETSAKGSVEGLHGLHRDTLVRYPNENVLFMHLGVRKSQTGFLLESMGYNEASFKLPDQRSYQPQKLPVSSSNEDIAHSIHTSMPVGKILRQLREGHGYTRQQVGLSYDPGRYVCNYLFYSSLEYCAANNNKAALFVHCPPVDVVNLDGQCQFLVDLIGIAKDLYTPAITTSSRP